MTEQIEYDCGEPRIDNTLTGEVQSPTQHQRLFKNLDALLDFLKFSRPAAFHVESGVIYSSVLDENVTSLVWRVNYVYSDGSK